MIHLYVLRPPGLNPPELHIAVDHKGYPDICDSCSLQGNCDREFGPKGINCQIHSHGFRWQHVPMNVVEEIVQLHKGKV